MKSRNLSAQKKIRVRLGIGWLLLHPTVRVADFANFFKGVGRLRWNPRYRALEIR